MKLTPLSYLLCVIVVSSAHGAPLSIDLGTAGLFGVLAGSTVTNTGPTTITGNVGVWPGTAITGFPPGAVGGGNTIYSAGAVPGQAQTDLTAAYNTAAGESCSNVLTGEDLGGKTILPGTYCFTSSAQLTGTVTLDGLGDSASVFIFQIGSTLTTASASVVDLINSAQGANVFWQIGSSATLGTTTSFAGNILALTTITLNTGATIECGRALARNGAVNLDSNIISICASGTGNGGGDGTGNGGGDGTGTGGNGTGNGGGAEVPEPGTVALFGAGLLILGVYRMRKS